MVDDNQIILIADDDEEFRLLVRSTLERSDYVVVEADNGDMAVKKFRSLNPNLVLLDVVMPEKNGFDTCQEIRQSPKGLNTPIVMITSLDDVKSVQRAYEMGATDFITKPVDWSLLNMRVNFLIRANHKILQTIQKSVTAASGKNAPDMNRTFSSSIDHLQHQLGPHLLKNLLDVIDDSINEINIVDDEPFQDSSSSSSKPSKRFKGIDEGLLLQLRLQEMHTETEFVNPYLVEITQSLEQSIDELKQAVSSHELLTCIKILNTIKSYCDYIGAADLSRLITSVLFTDNNDVLKNLNEKFSVIVQKIRNVQAYIDCEMDDSDLELDD